MDFEEIRPVPTIVYGVIIKVNLVASRRKPGEDRMGDQLDPGSGLFKKVSSQSC